MNSNDLFCKDSRPLGALLWSVEAALRRTLDSRNLHVKQCRACPLLPPTADIHILYISNRFAL